MKIRNYLSLLFFVNFFLQVEAINILKIPLRIIKCPIKVLWKLNNFKLAKWGIESSKIKNSITLLNFNNTKFNLPLNVTLTLSPWLITSMVYLYPKILYMLFFKKKNIDKKYCEKKQQQELENSSKIKNINDFLDRNEKYIEIVRNLNPLTNALNYCLNLVIVENYLEKIENNKIRVKNWFLKKYEKMKNNIKQEQKQQQIKEITENETESEESQTKRMFDHIFSLFIGKNKNLDYQEQL